MGRQRKHRRGWRPLAQAPSVTDACSTTSPGRSATEAERPGDADLSPAHSEYPNGKAHAGRRAPELAELLYADQKYADAGGTATGGGGGRPRSIRRSRLTAKYRLGWCSQSSTRHDKAAEIFFGDSDAAKGEPRWRRHRSFRRLGIR